MSNKGQYKGKHILRRESRKTCAVVEKMGVKYMLGCVCICHLLSQSLHVRSCVVPIW